MLIGRGIRSAGLLKTLQAQLARIAFPARSTEAVRVVAAPRYRVVDTKLESALNNLSLCSSLPPNEITLIFDP